MITVERKRRVAAKAERVRALIADVEQLPRLLPRVVQVEILARNENRAHLALWARIGRPVTAPCSADRRWRSASR